MSGTVLRAPLTRVLVSIPRASLPASFISLPVSSSTSISSLSRSFTSSTALQAASATSHSSSHSSHDSHGGHAGAGGHHGGEDRSGPDYGLHFHEPSRWHKVGAQVFGGLLWFWLLYRAKNDWKYLFFWENPFDSHDEPHSHSTPHSPEPEKHH